MKFRITLKDPDGFYEGIRDAAESSLKKEKGLSAEERESLIESRVEKIGESLKKWVEYGEYVDIEFDTDAMTATVCEEKP